LDVTNTSFAADSAAKKLDNGHLEAVVECLLVLLKFEHIFIRLEPHWNLHGLISVLVEIPNASRLAFFYDLK
jgi:hypothetical protein